MTDSNNDTVDPEALNVLDYWFGEENLSVTSNSAASTANATPQPRFKLWFSGGQKVDDDIRARFSAIISRAETGQLQHWQDSAHGALALIIVLDQFPLNAYRRTARAFHLGDLALPVCHRGLDKGYDRRFNVMEKLFFYLPLEHSEDKNDQRQSLELFQVMHETSEGAHKEFTKKTLESAQEHYDIIERFGRYPFRNKVLERESSAEEIAWLNENPGRFGQ